MTQYRLRDKGIISAGASAIFLGLSPIFGKQALLFGFSALAVVAIRTSLALLLLFFFLILINRHNFYIYPIGLMGCLAAGFINGIGSIFYYSSLSRIDAGIGQLLYSFYPLFMVFWLLLDRQSVSRLTVVRLILILPGVYLLLNYSNYSIDPIGASLMIIAAVLYALHLLINQRVLYEVPAPTVTFYTLLSMSLTVVLAFLLFKPSSPSAENISWWPLLVLSLITFLSRVTLFFGVKHLGGIQTALLGLGEILVTVVVAQLYLGERFSAVQWLGAIIIFITLILAVFDKPMPRNQSGKGFLHWLNPPIIK